MSLGDLPHRREVIAASGAAIVGYLVFSVWVVVVSSDAALKGDVIGTWKSFAVLAFGFWLGSSSGGKTQASDQAKQINDLTETTREMAKSVPNVATTDSDTLKDGDTLTVTKEANV